MEYQSPEPTSWLRSFREKAPSRRRGHDVVEIHVLKETDVRVEDQAPEPTSWLRSFREKAPSRRRGHDVVEIHVQKETDVRVEDQAPEPTRAHPSRTKS